MARIDRILVGGGNGAQWTGAGSNRLIQTLSGVYYQVFVETSTDLVFSKSTDGGKTWSVQSSIFVGSVTAFAVWYDRWSNFSGDEIHIAWTDADSDDVLYNAIDTASSDALAGQTVVFAGASTASGGTLSITRARGGNIYVAFDIDGGTENGFYRSTDGGGTWGSRASPMESAINDQIFLLPGWAADNQDIMAVFGDASASELSYKLYDDSADSWAETSISTSVSIITASSTDYPHISVAVDIDASQNLVAFWTNRDVVNADHRCFTISESGGAVETATNIVLNSVDDQGFSAIGINTQTGYWYAAYVGKSDGSETFATSTVNYKFSTDDGATWSAELPLTSSVFGIRAFPGIPPRFTGNLVCAVANTSGGNTVTVSVEVGGPASGNTSGGLQ